MHIISMCGSSLIVHGTGVNLTGPTRPYGPTFSLHTGSNNILTPLSAPSARVVSIKKDACPIHVAFSPFSGVLKTGWRTCTRVSREEGTGTKFLAEVPIRVFINDGMPGALNEGHGFLNDVGGVPTWWDGGVVEDAERLDGREVTVDEIVADMALLGV
jgi:hypothetical protein